jgi:hypothetical protein
LKYDIHSTVKQIVHSQFRAGARMETTAAE